MPRNRGRRHLVGLGKDVGKASGLATVDNGATEAYWQKTMEHEDVVLAKVVTTRLENSFYASSPAEFACHFLPLI
jgi:hypothetical protein